MVHVYCTGCTGFCVCLSGFPLTSLPSSLPAQVFGKVLEGMDIVRQIESLGSQSGKPAKEVRIAASGELQA